MLHRSFKPAKCKTALKLAVSRIKLLKNKRGAQVKQLKRELAQLLESGQDQTARIRVEHVVREEKTMAAYDLIEIYCELISARLPMIESQKNCPIDLKEAISSVIFASPRCSDLPELMDVRKHITAKYGKEFISAAVELRPDCGVNRLLVEKLSAKAPDGPTKMKILTAIAEEHNIKWEPKSFGESDVKLSQVSQVGTNAYEKSNYVEPPQVHVPPVRDEEGPPNLHGSSPYEKMQNTPTNLVEATSVARKIVGGNESTTSGFTSPGIRFSGTRNQEMDSAGSHYENRRDAPMDNINWNMEFKDAASAAQAAAESAERASMAAWAAAELSNRDRISRQYSGGSQSSESGLRDEVPQEFAFHDDKHLPTERLGMTASAAAEQSNHEKSSRQYSTGAHISRKSNELPQEYPPFLDGKHISTGSADKVVHSSSLAMHNEQINRREQDRPVRDPDEYYRNIHENVPKRPQSTSFTTRGPFNDDNLFAVDSKMANLYHENNSFKQENSEYLYEVSMKEGVSGTDVDVVSEQHADVDTEMENYDLFGDGRMDGQSRKASPSAAPFIMPSDDRYDVFKWNDPKINSSPGGDLFATDEGNTHRIYMETTSHDDTPVVFDDSASEDDDYTFLDKTHGEQGSGSFFSSLDNKLHADPLSNSNAWSPGQVVDENETSLSSQSHFSEVSESLRKSAVSSGKEELPPVTFDDSDGPGSDSEEDMVKSNVSESYSHGNAFPGRSANDEALETSSLYGKNVDSERKFGLSSSLADLDTVEEHFKGKIDITCVPEKNHSYDDLPTNKPSSEASSSLSSNFKTSVLSSKSPDTLEESRIEESGKELNYGSLKGGFRNKGIRRPPYLKSSNKGSSSLEDIPVQNEGSFPSHRTSVNPDAHRDAYKSKVSGGRSGMIREQKTLDSGSYNPVLKSQEDTIDTQDPHIQKQEESEARKKSSSKVSYACFDSDISYSEDEVPKQNSASRARPISGFSRRTTSKSGASSTSKDAPSASGSGLLRKSSRASNESEKQKMASSRMMTSDNLATPDHGPAEKAAFKPVPDSHKSSDEFTRSSAKVQPSHPLPKTMKPDNVEASGSSNTDGPTSSKDNAASHVHPKLPDYDSFAAHFLSLKKGRQ